MNRRTIYYDEEPSHGVNFRRVRILVVLGCVLLALIYVVVYSQSLSLLPIRQVQVVGQGTNLKQSEVQGLVTPLLKGNFFTVDLPVIHAAVAKHGWVEEVTVQRIWPDTLRILVRERQAIGRWHTGGLLSDKGKVFHVKSADEFSTLPLFSGPTAYAPFIAKYYSQMKTTLAPLGLAVQQVRVSPRRAWTLQWVNGVELNLGRGHVVQRAQRLAQVYRTVLEPYESNIRMIDLRYSNGFAVKWKSNVLKPIAFGG